MYLLQLFTFSILFIAASAVDTAQTTTIAAIKVLVIWELRSKIRLGVITA
jgi:hypothetical protein